MQNRGMGYAVDKYDCSGNWRRPWRLMSAAIRVLLPSWGLKTDLCRELTWAKGLASRPWVALSLNVGCIPQGVVWDSSWKFQ